MEVEAVIELVDQLLRKNGRKGLNTLRTGIFRLCWQQKTTYKKIAEQIGYEEQSIKDAASELWNDLTEIFQEKVKKTNFKAVLERKLSEPSNLVNRASNQPHQYWGDAPDIEPFYGRADELAKLEKWIIDDRCRLVTILGMAAMGKTSLAVKLAQQIQTHFDYVIWRSLRHAPPIAEILADWIKILSNQTKTDLPEDVNQRISLLITEYLRNKR